MKKFLFVFIILSVSAVFAAEPYNPETQISVKTASGKEAIISGPGRFEVLDAAFPPDSDIKIERIRNKNPEFDGFKIGDDSTSFFVTMQDLIKANKSAE